MEVYDWDRGRIDEVLPVENAEYPEQLPLLDSHSRYSVHDVLGSVRGIRKEGDKLVATAYFSDTERANNVFILVRGKHLTDVSIGYRVSESQFVEDGKKEIINNKEYLGTKKGLRVARKYKILEASLTPVGANDEAKVRSFEEKKMAEEAKTEGVKEPAVIPVVTQERKEPPAPTREDVVGEERKRTTEIIELCRSFDMDANDFIKRGASVQEVKDLVLKTMSERRKPGGVAPSVVKDEGDKKFRYVEDSLSLRMGLPVENKEVRSRSMVDLARMCLSVNGKGVDMLSPHEIARMCLRSGGMGGFSHTGSDFPGLLANVINKRLGKSFDDAKTTYQLWVNIIEVPDFKDISVIRMSEGQNLQLVLPGGEYPESTFSEEKETYKLDKFGIIFSITWESIVNDNLRFFEKIAKMQGNAAKRKVNTLAYSVLTANAALGDGVALFHATHKNLGTAAALSHDSLSKARAAMRTQKGMSGSDEVALNIPPAYLIVPPSLETTAKQLVGSEVVPGANQGHSLNTFKSSVEPVVEGILEANSATAWYLASDNNANETVEVAFLEGMRTPHLEQQDGFESDGRKYKVKLPCAAKAIDYRGLFKNPGV